MKMILRNRQRNSISILSIGILCFGMDCGLTVQAEQKPTWRVTKISEFHGNEVRNRGLLLFTANPEEKGAAFRCEGGKLYAFLTPKPIDFSEILQQRSPSRKDREVSFSIGSKAEKTEAEETEAEETEVERTENWVQMFGGQVYMVRKISTTLDIFKGATQGATITFTRKYNKAVTITLPEMDQEKFKSFLETCDLSEEYRPK